MFNLKQIWSSTVSSKFFFLVCHNSCKTCKGNKSDDCLSCMDGFRQEENIDNEDEMKCTDINECIESPNLCPVGTYCLNNEGSYSCEGKLVF